MPEQYRIYEFKTNNNKQNIRDKVITYLPTIGIVLIALIGLSLFGHITKGLTQKLIIYPIFIVSLVLHELSHGYMADFLGDPTPRQSGRLTLNPLKHLDLWGTLLFLICGFGWANPVPVNPNYFKKPDRAMVSVALAGPMCNLILAIIAASICKLIIMFQLDVNIVKIISPVCFFTSYINIMLAVFNLIPIPPLDGSRLVHYLLPVQYKAKYYQFSQQYSIIIFILVFMYAGEMITPITKQLIHNLYSLFGLRLF